LTFDAAPQSINDMTALPIRALSEASGASVSCSANTRVA
jgi:hypothetical protein